MRTTTVSNPENSQVQKKKLSFLWGRDLGFILFFQKITFTSVITGKYKAWNPRKDLIFFSWIDYYQGWWLWICKQHTYTFSTANRIKFIATTGCLMAKHTPLATTLSVDEHV